LASSRRLISRRFSRVRATTLSEAIIGWRRSTWVNCGLRSSLSVQPVWRLGGSRALSSPLRNAS
jgi:hypothetical protein